MMKRSLLLLAWLPAALHAAEPGPAANAGSMFQVLLGLIVVLGLMAGLAWLLKRVGPLRSAGAGTVKIVGGVNVGNRERVIVVEVADQWIVVGVAPGQVNSLATMARQEIAPSTPADASQPNFAAWLKKTIEKRNGN